MKLRRAVDFSRASVVELSTLFVRLNGHFRWGGIEII